MQELILSGDELCQVVTSILQDPKADTVCIQCEGNSMYPFIRAGSIVTIRCIITADKVKAGAIVVAVLDGVKRVVVHRVIKVTADERYLLKGDNVPEADGWVDFSNVVGVVQRIQLPSGKSRYPLQLFGQFTALLSKKNVIYHLLRLFGWQKKYVFFKK